jgi:hypothetical protein
LRRTAGLVGAAIAAKQDGTNAGKACHDRELLAYLHGIAPKGFGALNRKLECQAWFADFGSRTVRPASRRLAIHKVNDTEHLRPRPPSVPLAWARRLKQPMRTQLIESVGFPAAQMSVSDKHR